MWRFLGVIFLILGFCVAGYVVFVFTGQNYGTWKLSLIGPGKTPAQCMARAKPIFDVMKPQLDLAAQRLLNSDEYDVVSYGYDKEITFQKAQGEFKTLEKIEATLSEREFYLKTFSKVRGKNDVGIYYSPSVFGRGELNSGGYGVYIRNDFAECGYSAFEWVLLRLNLLKSHMEPTQPTYVNAPIQFIYRESGWLELEQCSESFKTNNDLFDCQEKIAEKWIMHTRWITLPPSNITPEE